MHMKNKKLLSALTACVISFTSAGISLPPVTAAALPADAVHVSDTVASGTCGGELKWWLESDGTLTISGNDYMSESPWRSRYSADIRRVIIDKDVKNIYEYAFYDCNNLKSVTFMGNSVETIGECAFYGCVNLMSFSIPDSVTTIGKHAFRYAGCYSDISGVHYVGAWVVGFDDGIRSAYIKSGTRRLCDYAFYDCKSLTSVEFSYSVECIAPYAFYGTGLTSVSIPYNISYIDFSAFKFCISLTELEIENGAEKIYGEAFSNCNRLTAIDLPASVSWLGDGAFYDCTDMTSVTVRNPKCSIGSNAFGCSRAESLPYRIYSGYENSTMWEYVSKRIDCEFRSLGGEGESEDCSWTMTSDGIMTIYGSGVTPSLGWGSYAKHVKEIRLEGNFTEIGSFKDFTALTTITIPDTVTRIGSGAFSGCTALTDITLPAELTELPNDLFSGCSSLTSVVLPETVESIGSNAFSGCSSLRAVVLPETVESIGEKAFSGCSALVSCNIPKGITAIPEELFSGCSSLTAVDIPEAVERIGSGAFQDCTSLQTVTFRNPDCKITEKSGDTAIPCGTIYGYGGSTAEEYAETYGLEFRSALGVLGTCGKNLSYLLQDGVLTISGSGAMDDWRYDDKNNPWRDSCGAIQKVVLEDGVTTIGNYAFYNFTQLTEIIIPESVTSIGNDAFHYCSGLLEIVIPENVTTIGEYAFYCCSKLTDIIIPESVVSIGKDAFESTGLDSITIKNPECKIETESYYSSDTIPDDTVIYGYIDSTAYYYSQHYGQQFEPFMAFEESCGNDAFWKMDSFGNMNIYGSGKIYAPDDSKMEQTFYRELVRTIVLEDGITSIDDGLFSDCANLTSVTLSGQLKYIGASAFADCSSLCEITIPDTVTSIGFGAFARTGLYSVVIPNSVTELDTCAFSACGNLYEVTLSSSLACLKYNTFNYCPYLEHITFLNPDCEIKDVFSKNITIHGYEGSTAEQFATESALNFVSLGKRPTVTDMTTVTTTVTTTTTTTTATSADTETTATTTNLYPDDTTPPRIIFRADDEFSWSGNDVLSLWLKFHVTDEGSGVETVELHFVPLPNGNAADAWRPEKIYRREDDIYEVSITMDFTMYYEFSWYLTATDYAGNVAYYGTPDDCYTFSTVAPKEPAEEPPVITAELVTSPLYASAATIEADVVSTGGKVKYAQLFYRTDVTGDWEKVFMKYQGNDHYTVTLPKEVMRTSVLSYYIEAVDYSKNISRIDSSIVMIFDPTSPPQTSLTGDINGDNSIDQKDVVLMKRALAGWDVEIDEEKADLNHDGSFDQKDVVILRRYLAGGWDIVLE